MSALLEVAGLVKRFGGILATDHLDLSVEAGELHALIGPNGAGKTTLVAQLQGDLRPDGGSIRFAGREVTRMRAPARALAGIARSFQITSIFPEFTALANVALAVQAQSGHSFRAWGAAMSAAELTGPARGALDRVGLAHRAEVPAGSLAHGEQRQLELAMAIAGKPRLLLLDEPMAGMGHEESARMVTLLQELKRDFTILLVEHDMDAVFALADRITVLVYGRAVACGTPGAIRADAEVRRAYLGEPGSGQGGA